MCFNSKSACGGGGGALEFFSLVPLGHPPRGFSRETIPQTLQCDRGTDPALESPSTTEIAKISRY